MNFIGNRNFRAGPQTSLEGFICPQNSDKQQKIKVFGRSGGGIFIQHGYCTVITAQSIGDNFWVNQNVTIAFSGNGIPVIGDNVHIASDANVVGGIHIGNNVTIGAGTTVVRDVPDNTLVVSQKPRYIDKNLR